MIAKNTSFQSEKELVHYCGRLIQEAIDSLNIDICTKYEVPAPGAIPDLVLFSEYEYTLKYVITIEFKLSNWRRAIHQAFRHRNFGNEAYVILDQTKSRPAINNLDLFQRANVGLVTINANGETKTWYSPEPKLPFSKEFSQIMARSLLSPQKSIPTDMPFIRSIQGSESLSKLKNIWNSSAYIAA